MNKERIEVGVEREMRSKVGSARTRSYFKAPGIEALKCYC